jgi:chromosome partitioning protein
MKNCIVISIANQKGGVGKTTTTVNLAYALKEKGKNVLVIDFDPQASATTFFKEVIDENNLMTIHDLMLLMIQGKELPPKSEYIKSHNDIDIIPSTNNLSATEFNLVNVLTDREFMLKNILDKIKSDYDYILIDNNPHLGTLTINAFTASDYILITTKPEFLDVKGLELLLPTIFNVKRRLNPNLSICGILITMFKTNTNLGNTIKTSVDNAYGSKLTIFESKIPTTIKVGEANLYGKSIIEYLPQNPASLAYKQFAEEFLERVGE